MSDIDVKEESIFSILKGTKPKIKEGTIEGLRILKEGSSTEPAIVPFPDEEYPKYDLPQPEGAPDERIEDIWQGSSMGEKMSVSRILAQQLEIPEKEALRNVETLTAMIPGTEGDVKKAYNGFRGGWNHAITQSELNKLSFLQYSGQIRPPEVYEAQIAIEKQKLPKATNIEEIRKQMESPAWEKILKLERKHEQAIKTYARMDELEKQMLSLTPENARWWMPKYRWSMGAFASQRLLSMREGLVMSSGPAVIGGLIGGPPGAAAGFTFGLTAGISTYWTRQMIGASYRNQLRMGIDPKVARWIALPNGALQAAVEILQTITPVKGLPGITRALPKIAGEAVLTTTRNGTLRAIALKAMGRMVETGAIETLEELVQEQVIDTLADYMAIELTNRYKPDKYKLEHQDWKNYVKESVGIIMTMMPIGTVMGAPGGTLQFSTDVMQMQKEKAIVTSIIEKQPPGKGKLLSEWYPEIEKPVGRKAEREAIFAEAQKPSPEEIAPKEIEAEEVKRQEIVTRIIKETPEEREIPAEEMEIEGEKYSAQEVRDIEIEARAATIEELLQEPIGKITLGKAYTAGKQMGLEQQRATQRQAKLKERIFKEHRQEFKKMVRDLKTVKQNLGHMTEGQANPIRKLIDNLDLVKRREKTIARLEKTRAYFENNPEAEIPDSVKESLQLLEKKNLNDISTEQFEDIYKAIMHHVYLEKKKQELWVDRKIRKFNEALNQSIDELRPFEKIIPEDEEITSKLNVGEKVTRVGKKIKNFFGLRHNHYDLIIETLAGPNSTMDKVLFTGLKDGIRNQLKHRQNTFKQYQNDLQKAKYDRKDTNQWLKERVKTGRFNLTRNERMDIYNHMLNKDSRRHVLEGGIGFKFGKDADVVYKINPEEVQAILESLTSEELAFAGAPVRNLFKNQGLAINKVFKQKNNYPLKLVDPYYPIEVMPISRGLEAEKESALEQFQGKWTRIGIKKGMLETRKKAKHPLYIKGLTKTINESVMNTAAYVGLEIPLSNASKLLYNKEFKQALRSKYGKETWQEIDKGLRDIAGEWKSYTDFEEALLKLRGKLSSSILGVNPFVIVKQPLSYAGYSVYVEPKYLMQGLVDSIIEPKLTEDRHRSFSPEYVERYQSGFSRDVSEVLRQNAERQLFGGKAAPKQRLMAGITFADKKTVTPGMQGAVLQVLDEIKEGKFSDAVKQALDVKNSDIKNLTAKQKVETAYRFADWVTNRTQPTFAPEHRSSLSRGTPIEKMFTQFSSYTNQALNLLRRTFNDAVRTRKPAAIKRAAKAFVAIMVLNTLGNVAVNELRNIIYGKPEKERDKFFVRILKSWAGMFYIVREIVQSLSSKIKKGTYAGYDIDLPTLRVGDLFVNTMAHFFRMMGIGSKTKRKKEALKFIDDSAELIFTLNGIPYSAPRKMTEAVVEQVKKLK